MLPIQRVLVEVCIIKTNRYILPNMVYVHMVLVIYKHLMSYYFAQYMSQYMLINATVLSHITNCPY